MANIKFNEQYKSACIDLTIAFDKFKEQTGLSEVTIKLENRTITIKEER